jgi:2-phosphoglycerate kinase
MPQSIKPVIFIGGASGGGKTTLSRELSTKLGIDHRLGTGFVRAIVQSETNQDVDPTLFSFTFDAIDPIANALAQAERIKPAVAASVNRSRSEGTSLVIEGAHLIPSVYEDLNPDVFIILKSPELNTHVGRIRGDSHRFRVVDDIRVQKIRQLNDFYLEDSKGRNVFVIEYDKNLIHIIDLIRSKIQS